MTRVYTIIVALTLSFTAHAQLMDAFPEISSPEREVAARKALEATDTVVVYAKGLCCPSCAIGIRKKVSKLPFVDHSRFNQGVDLDPKTQLVHVALLPGKPAEAKLLKEAIAAAGYDAVRLFRLEKNQLKVHQYAQATN